MSRNEPTHKTLGTQIMHLFDTKPSNSFSLQTHQVNYVYGLDKIKSMVPNVIISKKYDQQTNTMMKIQMEKEELFAKPEVMRVLDDIFNIKLQGKYQNNISEYVINEEKHHLQGNNCTDDDVDVKLFDDDDDDEIVDKQLHSEEQKDKIKLFEDDDVEDVPFMDQFKAREIQKEKTSKKRKRKEKKYSFMEDSDDEEDTLKSISVKEGEEADSDDEDLLKSKAAETHNFISSTKLKAENKPNKLAKRNKEKNEWKQIQTIMKGKDEEKKEKTDSKESSSDL